jgi:2-polyprenyl-3-methyl-5-hydroxy-6-metoxy-1,4-benzoquinol methylase
MSCPQCHGIESMFNSGMAERELKDYRAHGPQKTTRMLLDAIKASSVAGLSLLDIGGGVGAIQHELFKVGVNKLTAVDGSSAYLWSARQEAERVGHVGQVNYFHGDFVELAPRIPQADIVTLEKVICCYPDMQKLVGLSSARAGKLYGVVFPCDTWWMKAGAWVLNFIQGLRHNNFRFFVHPTAEVDAIVRGNGLERRAYHKTLFWQVIIYAR